MFEKLGVSKVGVMQFQGRTDASTMQGDKSPLMGERFVNYLWVKPEMLDLSADLAMYWQPNHKLIKIRGYLHQNWYKKPDLFRKVLHVASRKNVPVMFHTGGDPCSDALQHHQFCQEFSEVK